MQTTTESQSTSNNRELIRPFEFNFPEQELVELKKRIQATRWPERETVSDFSQGVPLQTIQKLARYWLTEYDWRKCEEKLRAVPHFITEIDGLDIHFIHVRSKHENALPVIITHGWPGSIVEQLKIIDPLVNPTAHGASASDEFDVVIPSMPGFGFSGKPTEVGWGPLRIAKAWTTLMKRLGYEKFVAQGGDWGAVITELMAVEAPKELLAIHTNMPSAVPPDLWKIATSGGEMPSGLAEDEKRAFDQLKFFFTQVSYATLMGTRPQTLVGIADSPVGLAAYMLDHDLKSLELIARSFDGKNEGLTRDDVLDNVTLFWLTNTAISSSRLYWENKYPFFLPLNVKIPIAISAFADELYQCPKSWAERAYPKLMYYNAHDNGCHFAAWEQPKALSDDMRAGFQSLRKPMLH